MYLGSPPWVRGDPQAFVSMYTETYLPILLLLPSSTTLDLLQCPLVKTLQWPCGYMASKLHTRSQTCQSPTGQGRIQSRQRGGSSTRGGSISCYRARGGRAMRGRGRGRGRGAR